MTIRFNAKLVVDPDPLRSIYRGLHKGVAKATRHYQSALQTSLRRTVGSVPAMGGFRRRVMHSSPGQVPFWQTGNLANSISFSMRALQVSIRAREIVGRVSTKVRYAKTLERGGQLTVPQSEKTFTGEILINPIRTNPFISPRPAWAPLLRRERKTIFNIIAQEARANSI